MHGEVQRVARWVQMILVTRVSVYHHSKFRSSKSTVELWLR